MLTGRTVPVGQIRSQRYLGHRLRLRCWALPHRNQEPGGGDLLPGGQDRWHHLPPAGPSEEVLAARSGLHHGGRGNNCRLPCCPLPWDPREKTSWDHGWCHQVRDNLIKLSISLPSLSIRLNDNWVNVKTERDQSIRLNRWEWVRRSHKWELSDHSSCSWLHIVLSTSAPVADGEKCLNCENCWVCSKAWSFIQFELFHNWLIRINFPGDSRLLIINFSQYWIQGRPKFLHL